jgi:hypothetical protein
VDRHYLDRQQLLESLRLHTYRLVVELLGWESGEFKFYSGDEVAYEEGVAPIGVEELLIQSVEEAAGEGHPTIPDSFSLYEQAPGGPPIRVRPEGEEPPAEAGEVIWLTEGESEIYDHLADGHTVGSLVTRTGADSYRVRYTLHRLLELEVVRRRPPEPQVELAAELAGPAAADDDAEEAATWDSTGDWSPEPIPDWTPDPAPAPPPETPSPPSDLQLPGDELLPAEPPEWEMPARRPVGMASVWPGRLLAVLALVVLLLVLIGRPVALLLPFPWQQEQQAAFSKNQSFATFQKIDQAAKTFYLVEGRFPDSLEQLVDLGLLAGGDLRDAEGRPLLYVNQGLEYSLQPLAVSGEPAGEPVEEAVSGNFLLDPEFLAPAESQRPPLVLLD